MPVRLLSRHSNTYSIGKASFLSGKPVPAGIANFFVRKTAFLSVKRFSDKVPTLATVKPLSQPVKMYTDGTTS